MGNKQQHLVMLQAVIARMASNAFLLKGWCIALISALFSLAAAKANPYFVFLTLLPVAMLWGLDGYFLRQERLFRELYNRVRQQSEDSVDYSMDTAPVSSLVDGWLFLCVSLPLSAFYGTVYVSIVLAMIILGLST